MNSNDKKQLKKIRKLFQKEIKRLRIKEPKMSLHADYRTKRLKIVYGLYIDKGVTFKGERVIRKKQDYLYLKDVTIYDEDVFLINFKKYVERISKRIETTIRSVGTNNETIQYWGKAYYANPKRRFGTTVSNKTLVSDKRAIQTLISYVDVVDGRMHNIWNWIEGGRKFFTEYLQNKQSPQKIGGHPYPWKQNTVAGNYNTIRAFFNWISTQVDGFPKGILAEMGVKKEKTITSSFTSEEMVRVKGFIEEQKDTKEWGWFVKMLCVMLETGARSFEVAEMKIKDIEPQDKTWWVLGKGRGGGKRRINKLPDYVWDMIENRIVDENGMLRRDKEYVFHKKFYQVQDKINHPNSWALDEDLNEFVKDNTYRKRFKQMVRMLDCNEELSPHSCRRYFITEMLKKTNGNIPLVAELVGHEDWDMVKHYAKSVITERENTNLGLFDEEDKTASIPIMITKKMRIQLKEMMYPEEKIKTLTPIQAHEILQRGF